MRKWTAAVAAVTSTAVMSTVVPAWAAPAPPPDGAGSGERPAARALPALPAAAPGLRYTSALRLSRGVVARTFETSGTGVKAAGDLVDVDLRAPHVRVGLLRPGAIAARATVSDMANAQRAIAGVNGDFFNISETHEGVPPTGSSSGPEVDGGRALKAAVPDGQRFGPALPPGTSARDVIGVGADGRGHVASLRLAGTVRARLGTLKLDGLNQYALPEGGVGAFTSEWGTVSRQRAVCGSDDARNDPCSTRTAEVTVRRGVVTAVSDEVGAGAIPKGATVLVGRDEGAAALLKLRKGDRVKVRYRLAGKVRFRFAVGGFPILRHGRPLSGLDAAGPAPRTAAGVSRDGRHLYLAVVDGRSETSGGVTVAELAGLLARAGASDGVNLDGGGSSAFVARAPGEPSATVRNVPSDGRERAVANGIGVFS
ncbi:phosphodiester glycosidase family protein [Actinomadura violacea]|uniref:Phosphodiester glycosidase family protein n=1 Tax=Actinomadura violacea TaxID=2819934 RepID=A0ABS3RPX0_9ACTN|nr:phosphodiester glycosidase family protein [Actinomadura violacea]MBO2458787.1 phosphodiester glycosidase family protein [Actinomadura violacea]